MPPAPYPSQAEVDDAQSQFISKTLTTLDSLIMGVADGFENDSVGDILHKCRLEATTLIAELQTAQAI